MHENMVSPTGTCATPFATRSVRRELDENKTLLIGADTTGRLLEVVVADIDTDLPRIIHAMALRASFYRFLEGR